MDSPPRSQRVIECPSAPPREDVGEFCASFREDFLNSIPLAIDAFYGMINGRGMPSIIAYPKNKSFAVAVSVDWDLYKLLMPQFSRPLDFDERPVVQE